MASATQLTLIDGGLNFELNVGGARVPCRIACETLAKEFGAGDGSFVKAFVRNEPLIVARILAAYAVARASGSALGGERLLFERSLPRKR